MATEANESRSPSASAPSESSNKKMVLRARSNNNKLAVNCGEEEDQRRISKKRKTPQKKKIDKIDATKPKKPPTAFFYFLEDFRKEFQEKNPDIKMMRDIGKAGGVKWKTMTYEEKIQYYDVATEKRAEFDRSMADYMKKQESGEYEETESNSDSEWDE